MKHVMLGTSACILGLLAGPEVAYSESTPIPREVVAWKLGGKSGNLRSQNQYTTNTGYNLLNVSKNEYLTWGKQNLGINLVFSKSSSDKKVHFAAMDKKERDILTGENVAFGIGGGEAFLCYAHRDVGINLEWRVTPCYEWRLFDETGEEGKRIAVGTRIAIGNIKVEPTADFLIYHYRPEPAASVGWPSSPSVWDRLSVAAKTGLGVARKLLEAKAGAKT